MSTRVGELTRAVWELSRPAIWLVSVLPYAVGHLLATHSLWPSLPVWTRLADRAAHGGVTPGEIGAAARAAWSADHRWLLAGLAVGPLFWASSLLLNDAYDLPGDRLNPRKATTPLVRGMVSTTWVRRAGYAFGVTAVGVGLAVGVSVGVFVAVLCLTGWVYSVPPLRLKLRPGADLVSNAVAVGAVTLLAGWSVARPWPSFPWVMLPQGVLVAAALYAPTTLVDLDADRQSGYPTLATAFGPSVAYRVGWWSWCLACAGAVLLSATGTVMPRRLLPVLAVGVPVLLAEYALLIGRPRAGLAVVRGIVVCSVTFLLINLVFAMLYAGLIV